MPKNRSSSHKKILTIVGARPQFIKAAAVSEALVSDQSLTEVILHTGQHFDQGMSQVFFDELKIPKPTYNLNINGGPHGQMTGRMLENIESIMETEAPQAVLIYGDTNSTLAGALAAAKLHIPICHVEAGLRSFNRQMPEEINRVMADHLSTLLFCPTKSSVKNLENEGITKGVFHVGDVMYDAVLQTKSYIQKNVLKQTHLDINEKNFGILTIHRAENTTQEQFKKIIDYVEQQSEKLNGMKILFPIHPRTKQILDKMHIKFTNIVLCDPKGYIDMQNLLSQAKMVFTDSGGLQKEAYFHQVPCVTLRSETEWVETVHSGWNRLWTSPEYTLPRKNIIDYGEGKSAFNIVSILKTIL